MKKCRHAKEYKGVFPPRCNNGKGCDACRVTFQNACSHPVTGFVVNQTENYRCIKCSRCDALVHGLPNAEWEKISELASLCRTLEDRIASLEYKLDEQLYSRSYH